MIRVRIDSHFVINVSAHRHGEKRIIKQIAIIADMVSYNNKIKTSHRFKCLCIWHLLTLLDTTVTVSTVYYLVRYCHHILQFRPAPPPPHHRPPATVTWRIDRDTELHVSRTDRTEVNRSGYLWMNADVWQTTVHLTRATVSLTSGTTAERDGRSCCSTILTLFSS